MAESKAKSKVSGKPVSASIEPKTKVKTKATKPAAEKVKTVAAKPKVAKPKAAPAVKRSVKAPMLPISAELHYRMVAEAAYYIAERRGFAPGDAAADWAQAEKQIATALKK